MSAFPFLLAVALGQTSTKKADVKLIDLTPVTQSAKYSVFKMSKEFSIGGVVLRDGIQLLPQGDTANERSGRLVYSIPRGMQVFRCNYGVADVDNESRGDASLAIFVDGEAIQTVQATSGQKPVSVDIPVKNARSIMFQFTGTAALGNGWFLTTPSSKPITKPTTPVEPTPKPVQGEMPRANLTMPENGKTFNNSVTLKWDAVPDAISYGVEIVMITNANPKKIPARFIRTFSAKSETFEWNFSDDVLSGDYQASVIAFGKAGVLTKFSNSRRFKVERK